MDCIAALIHASVLAADLPRISEGGKFLVHDSTVVGEELHTLRCKEARQCQPLLHLHPSQALCDFQARLASDSWVFRKGMMRQVRACPLHCEAHRPG